MNKIIVMKARRMGKSNLVLDKEWWWSDFITETVLSSFIDKLLECETLEIIELRLEQ
jgi:hypothetical protein